jgi:hypothetical protein
MKGNTRSNISILMGIVIAIADIYWTWTSYYDSTWLALGIIILIADIIWLYIDWSFTRK